MSVTIYADLHFFIIRGAPPIALVADARLVGVELEGLQPLVEAAGLALLAPLEASRHQQR